MPDLEFELDRARADAADHQAEAQDVADLARADEVAFHRPIGVLTHSFVT